MIFKFWKTMEELRARFAKVLLENSPIKIALCISFIILMAIAVLKCFLEPHQKEKETNTEINTEASNMSVIDIDSTACIREADCPSEICSLNTNVPNTAVIDSTSAVNSVTTEYSTETLLPTSLPLSYSTDNSKLSGWTRDVEDPESGTLCTTSDDKYINKYCMVFPKNDIFHYNSEEIGIRTPPLLYSELERDEIARTTKPPTDIPEDSKTPSKEIQETEAINTPKRIPSIVSIIITPTAKITESSKSISPKAKQETEVIKNPEYIPTIDSTNITPLSKISEGSQIILDKSKQGTPKHIPTIGSINNTPISKISQGSKCISLKTNTETDVKNTPKQLPNIGSPGITKKSKEAADSKCIFQNKTSNETGETGIPNHPSFGVSNDITPISSSTEGSGCITPPNQSQSIEDNSNSSTSISSVMEQEGYVSTYSEIRDTEENIYPQDTLSFQLEDYYPQNRPVHSNVLPNLSGSESSSQPCKCCSRRKTNELSMYAPASNFKHRDNYANFEALHCACNFKQRNGREQFCKCSNSHNCHHQHMCHERHSPIQYQMQTVFGDTRLHSHQSCLPDRHEAENACGCFKRKYTEMSHPVGEPFLRQQNSRDQWHNPLLQSGVKTKPPIFINAALPVRGQIFNYRNTHNYHP